MVKKVISYDVTPQFMKIEWNGDNGIGEHGRIAFPPKSFKEKIYGEKISFVFRGVGYMDRYHCKLKKGYYIALPVENLSDVDLKVELGDIIVKEGNIFKLEVAFIYSRKYKDEIYKSKFYKYERISLRDIEGKNSADVISWLFDVDKSIVEVCDKELCEFEERQGYVTHVYKVYTENNIFKIQKTGQYKNYRCMPFDKLLDEFKNLKVNVVAHYSMQPENLIKDGWKSSKLHKCIENYIWLEPKEPIYLLGKWYKITLDEFIKLRQENKIQINELEMRKIQGMSGDDYSSAFHYWEGDKLRRHLGYYSFDEFLQHLKEYDISGIKLEIDVLKQRIDGLKDIHNYYITLDKYEIEYHLFSLSNLTRCCFPPSDMIDDCWWKQRDIKSLEAKIGEIINNIEFDAYIKITKDTCDTNEPDYCDYDYDDDEEYYIEEKEAVIILPNKKEITFKYNLRYVNIFKPYEKQERKEEIEYEIKDIDNDRFNKIMEEVRKDEEEVKETKNKINELEERLKEVNESSTEELYKDIISIMR